MDRGAPPGLLDTAETAYQDTKALIERWHRRGRQLYAISPRFALTSSPAQLEAAGRLVREYPDCHVQTHISENLLEIEAVAAAYPTEPDYTAVYQQFGLLGPRSLMGHCLHLSDDELRRFHEAGAIAVFCPTSNTFLGSGLFDWARMRDPRRPVRVAVATDIGGGTSYSMLATMGEAYKVLRLQGQSLAPDMAFHAITRGNAVALGLENLIGSFEPGHECDAVVLDSSATPAMARRMAAAGMIEEELFVLATMGDDRAVRATYVMGEAAHRAGGQPC
jgi:guanine deaminase